MLQMQATSFPIDAIPLQAESVEGVDAPRTGDPDLDICRNVVHGNPCGRPRRLHDPDPADRAVSCRDFL